MLRDGKRTSLALAVMGHELGRWVQTPGNCDGGCACAVQCPRTCLSGFKSEAEKSLLSRVFQLIHATVGELMATISSSSPSNSILSLGNSSPGHGNVLANIAVPGMDGRRFQGHESITLLCAQ